MRTTKGPQTLQLKMPTLKPNQVVNGFCLHWGNPKSETNQDFTKKEFVSVRKYNYQNLTVSSVATFHTTIFFYSAHFHSTVVSSICILPLQSAKRTKHLSLMKFCKSTFVWLCSFWTTDPIRKQPQGNIHVIQGSVTEESDRNSFKHIWHYLRIPALTSGLHYPSSPTQCHNLQGALPYDRAVGMWASLNMSSALGGPLHLWVYQSYQTPHLPPSMHWLPCC